MLQRLALGVDDQLVGLLLGVEEGFLLERVGVAFGVLDERGAAWSSARPTVSAAMRLRFATHQANTAPATTTVMTRLIDVTDYRQHA